jgi:putative glutamine amidotransferase
MRPLVAVSTYREPVRWGAWDVTAAVLHSWYVDALAAAGADAVLLPPGAGVGGVSRVDGLVLVGGADIAADRYGEQSHTTADTPRVDRDGHELLLYAEARARELPVLGICRGLQIMAVAHGGTLHQHLPEVTSLRHRGEPGTFCDHLARLTPGSHIARIFGSTEITVNSSHHQAVADPGGLMVTGHADDGTVEVCEDPSAPFVIGVQWHPEHPDRHDTDRPLFEAFIAACS